MTAALSVVPPIHAQLCTFWVDGLFFGVPVADVQEVIRFQQMTPVPCAPSAVHGLINLRGQIVTAVDLRTRLGLTGRPEGASPMNVIVRSRGEVVSLLVDDIGDVIDASARELEAPPSTLPSDLREAVHGVVSLDVPALPSSAVASGPATTILLVLDADRAVDTSSAPHPGGTP